MLIVLGGILQGLPLYVLLCALPCYIVAAISVHRYISLCDANDDIVVQFLHSLKIFPRWISSHSAELVGILSQARHEGILSYVLSGIIFSVPPTFAIFEYSRRMASATEQNSLFIVDLLFLLLCSLTLMSSWLFGRSIIHFARESQNL
ncbi:hypothetical protein ANRL4_01326 [Anaerolineae bacterium]|nr:hypothetical protein ANRL4_01326 [Anaerolineae bacterium]